MSKLVLHIGTHKTATTTIQNTFAANSGLLAQHGVIYPRFSRVTGHHGLVPNWPRMPRPYHLPGGSLETLAKIASHHADSDDTVFLSSEEFSRIRHLAEIGRIRDAFAEFDRVEVVCVLRTQWQFLQSVYLQISKKSSPPHPPLFVQPVIESGMCHGLWVDYNGILDALEPHFAGDEITFLDFDACRKAEGGIVGSFLRHLGLPIGADALVQVNGGMSNVSPLSLASWAANLIAEPKAAPSWLIKKTTKALRVEFGEDIRPCLFSREEFAALKDHFSICNARLEQRRAAVQPGFALQPADAKGLKPFRDDILGSYWLRCAQWIAVDHLT